MHAYMNIPLAFSWHTLFNVLAVILVVLLVLLAVLYFAGRKLEGKQVQSQKMIEASSQTVSMLIIDKKKMKLTETNLPKAVFEQTPKYLRWNKFPVVKAKVGPKIMTLIADGKVFKQLPVKAECKVKVSGIYITEIVKGAVFTEKEMEKGQGKGSESCREGSPEKRQGSEVSRFKK